MIGLATASAVVPAVAAETSAVTVELLHEDAERVRFAVRLREEASRLPLDDSGWALPAPPGVARVLRPGYPELPVVVLALVVPDSGDVSVDVDATGLRREIAKPRPVSAVDDDGRLARIPDPQVYEGDAVWPPAPVRLDLVRVEGIRLARLRVYPRRYDPASGAILSASTLEVTVGFEQGAEFRDPGNGALGRLAHLFLNHRSATKLARARVEEPDDPSQAAAKSSGPSRPGVKIRVDAEGWVRVEQVALAEIGFDSTGLDPRRLELSYRGTPVPCRVIGEDDGSFDPGDAIEFYGNPRVSRFSRSRVFWLAEIDEDGLRLDERSAAPGPAPLAESFPAVVHVEEGNGFYIREAPAVEGDPHFYWVWFDHDPTPPRVDRFEHAVTLPGRVPGGGAKLSALFSGRSDGFFSPDHLVGFGVNGTSVGESGWDGPRFHTVEIAFDDTLLTDGENLISMEKLSETVGDEFYLDWFEVEYPKATVAADDLLILRRPNDPELRYEVSGLVGVDDPLVIDVTHELAPVRLTEIALAGTGPHSVSFEDPLGGARRYLILGDGGRRTPDALTLDVPSNLKTHEGGADMIVVVPDGWESTVEPLVQHRREQGLRIVMASLTDVADEFAGGNVDDHAIRDFVRHAYESWERPAVSKLLLVGEPSLDPRNQLEKAGFVHLMPTHIGVTAERGETMSDTWFGDLTGNDLLPEIAVGRISTPTVEEMAEIVTKLIAYDTNWTGGESWVRKALHIASDEAQFEDSLAKVAGYLPQNYTVYREYRRAGADADSIRNRLNTGVSIASFVGHGNVNLWADKGDGTFWRTSNASSLANGGRLAFVTALNCLNGVVGDPYWTKSMAEAFVNRPHPRGALAVWSTTSLGFLGEFDALQEMLYRKAFGEYVRELGALTRDTLVETYLTRPVSVSLVKKMILIGDPSSRLHINCPTGATDATCDGVDDDCDGVVDDEWQSSETTCGEAGCEYTGSTECVDGVLIDTCHVPTVDVTCDGVDDDCDGAVDEEWTAGVSTCGLGLCTATGLTSCADGVLEDSCVPGVPADELCDTGLDEDCDGAVDEADAIDAVTWYGDVDGDGYGGGAALWTACSAPLGFVPDGTDCDDQNPLAWGTPGEVPEIRFTDPDRLAWTLPQDRGGEVVSEVLQATSGDGFEEPSRVCVEVRNRLSATLPEMPDPTRVWYYLVRLRSDCPDGIGPLGVDSDGNPRVTFDCGE